MQLPSGQLLGLALPIIVRLRRIKIHLHHLADKHMSSWSILAVSVIEDKLHIGRGVMVNKEPALGAEIVRISRKGGIGLCTLSAFLGHDRRILSR